jgi:hypothetical protein
MLFVPAMRFSSRACLYIREELAAEISFVAFDDRLANAARLEGLGIE